MSYLFSIFSHTEREGGREGGGGLVEGGREGGGMGPWRVLKIEVADSTLEMASIQ